MSQNQLQTVIDTLPDGVLIVTAEDRVVRYANPAACALLRAERSALVGAPFEYPLEYPVEYPVEYPREYPREDRGIISVGGQPDPGLCEIRVADSEWQGQRAHVLSIRDMGAWARERQLERQLARARSRSERGQLARSIAQELGDPASSLATNRAVFKELAAEFEAMCADPRVPRELRERYNVAQTLHDMRAMLDDDATSLDRIRSCVRELCASGQEKVDRVQQVELDGIVQRARRLIQAIHHGGDFQLACSVADVPPIAADELKLTQLVFHLMDNAIAALKGSRRGANTIELAVAVAESGSEVCITVRDSGRGMSREHLLRVFEPAHFSGSGHGVVAGSRLAMAAEIASAHGGRMEGESELGKGSVFRVLLPLNTGLAPSQPERRVLPGQVRARVLWLSSDDTRTTQVHELLDAEHDVVDSASKQHASNMLDRDRDYDVILADVEANPKDAMALHKTLAVDAPELARRMVLIAPSEMPANVRRFVEKSHLLVLDKPLSDSSLLEVVERMSF